MGAIKLGLKPLNKINQDPRITQAEAIEDEIKALQSKAKKIRQELDSENGYEILDNLINIRNYLKEVYRNEYNVFLDESIDQLGEIIDSLAYYYADQGLDTRGYKGAHLE